MFPLNLLPPDPGKLEMHPKDPSQEGSTGRQEGASGNASKAGRLLAGHKGKLAVGAAAMLGLAIFYRWRESKLAKEDPAQYAQLQRIKSAIANDAANTGQPNNDKRGAK